MYFSCEQYSHHILFTRWFSPNPILPATTILPQLLQESEPLYAIPYLLPTWSLNRAGASVRRYISLNLEHIHLLWESKYKWDGNCYKNSVTLNSLKGNQTQLYGTGSHKKWKSNPTKCIRTLQTHIQNLGLPSHLIAAKLGEFLTNQHQAICYERGMSPQQPLTSGTPQRTHMVPLVPHSD